MSAAKHTPGPWAVDMTTVTATVRAADGKSVARCYQGNHDAALIAAAPELLGCLIDLLDADGDLYAMDFNRYRAAVAAATGGDL